MLCFISYSEYLSQYFPLSSLFWSDWHCFSVLNMLVQGTCQRELKFWPLLTACWWPCYLQNSQGPWYLPCVFLVSYQLFPFGFHRSLGLLYSFWTTGASSEFLVQFWTRNKVSKREVEVRGTEALLGECHHHQAAAQNLIAPFILLKYQKVKGPRSLRKRYF